MKRPNVFVFFSLLLNYYPTILRFLERRKASHLGMSCCAVLLNVSLHNYTPTPIPTGLSSRIFSGNQTNECYLCYSYIIILLKHLPSPPKSQGEVISMDFKGNPSYSPWAIFTLARLLNFLEANCLPLFCDLHTQHVPAGNLFLDLVILM